MKRLSVILTLTLSLLLYGCGNQGNIPDEVSSDSVVESGLSTDSDTQAQTSPDADTKEDEDSAADVSDADNETESLDDKNDSNSDNNNDDKNDDKNTADSGAVTMASEDKNVENEVSELADTEGQNVIEYTVEEYEEIKIMYVVNSVNVRKGPSTDFEKVGSLNRGQEITVLGQADTDWYEIAYGENNEDKAFVSDKYLQNDKPADTPILTLEQELLRQELQAKGLSAAQIEAMLAAAEKAQADKTAAEKAQADAQAAAEKAQADAIAAAEKAQADAQAAAAKAQADAQAAAAKAQADAQAALPVTEVKNAAGIILVGDSRFVQMQEAVGPNPCTWIAEGGKGYTWFEEKAIPRIDNCIGSGSKILINLGVNDTRNLQKYITLINAKAAEWTSLGATVYYASVNPVWENLYVTEEQVEYFNTQMYNSLGPYVHWIDSHSYISTVGCKIVDGLHYSPETYQTLYSYFLNCMG